MKKTCLSIDLDVIMEWNTYSRFINHDVSPELAWKIAELIGQEIKEVNLKYNENVLEKLCTILERNQYVETIIIEEHDEIIKVLKERGPKWDVYNADFHHDITYDNDDSTLTIENWVRHGKNDGIIDEYIWLYRTMSEHPTKRLFVYKGDNILDVSADLFPKLDLIVICISKHFTPINYWIPLTNTLLHEIKVINEWRELHKDTLTREDYDSIPEIQNYLIDGTLPNTYRLFANGDLYLILEHEGEGYQLSMLTTGPNVNLFSIKEFIDWLLTQYPTIEFHFLPHIRNAKFIKRLAKQFNIVRESIGYYKIN